MKRLIGSFVVAVQMLTLVPANIIEKEYQSVFMAQAMADDDVVKPLPGASPVPHPGASPKPSPVPSPVPSASPTPTSSPNPGASPVPLPPNTDKAKKEGLADGKPDGAQEGNERAALDGRLAGAHAGAEAGRAEGYRVCAEQERKRQYDLGYRDGFDRGTPVGSQEGESKGRYDGDQKGRYDGNQDGDKRANQTAYNDATPRGRQAGYDQANQSDAPQQGQADGTVAGDQAAAKQARTVDYPRGRQQYQDQMLAQPVVNNDAFSMKAVTNSPSIKSSGGSGNFMSFDSTIGISGNSNTQANTNVVPDYRYSNPSRTYPTAEENAAYQAGYKLGYDGGFSQAYNATYQSVYNGAYQGAYQAGYQTGCEQAKHESYQTDRQRGYQDGYTAGYNDGYQRRYSETYRYYYDAAFRQASDYTYNQNYNGYYNQHYEAARSAAYRERYGDLYNAAYSSAKQAKYNQVYPGYAANENARGRADEAQDFADRPVRLLDAQVTETIVNGVMEPGEALRVKFKLRNFAAKTLAGKDVRITLQALDSSSSVVSEAEAVLPRDLKDRSVTDISNGLEFRMNENAVNRARTFRFTAFYQGRDIGSEDLSVTAQFQLGVVLAEKPTLSEGMPMPIRLKVTNQSNASSDALARMTLSTDANLIDLKTKEIGVGILQAGESKIIEVLGELKSGASNYLTFPLNASVTASTGRRIGLMEISTSAPVQNDYRVELSDVPSALRTAGLVRLNYSITNIRSNALAKGLQLKTRIVGENSTAFTVLGPNPQFLSPLGQGKTKKWVVPVMVKESNSGGTVELEVQENGRTVVVHRVEF